MTWSLREQAKGRRNLLPASWLFRAHNEARRWHSMPQVDNQASAVSHCHEPCTNLALLGVAHVL